ncbi:glycosyltransferase [Merdibacter massiliensis]|uniref:glycosyltransferase n=1 Tax=Merdibacter massiliensis TaxID=1871030 RepID=UPI00096AB968|nr:glycosyltransferase [Merdibacter massiliensis]
MTEVSVIMGIYNCSLTLDEAFNSLKEQTYKNWKLIMCDDGSTDNTYEIAKKIAENNDNVILLKNDKNRGLNYTLNKCLEYVDTEFVARMDADDISLPTRFEKEISFLKLNRQYSIVSTNMIYFDESGDWGKSNSIAKPEKSDFVKGTPFCHAPCMVRTIAYRKVKGYTVNKKLLRVEDYHLWFKMYLNGYIGYNLEEPLYKMRDDRAATKRRKFKYRLNEAYVKKLIVKDFFLPKYNYIYVLKPIIIGLLPTSVYEFLHRTRR